MHVPSRMMMMEVRMYVRVAKNRRSTRSCCTHDIHYAKHLNPCRSEGGRRTSVARSAALSPSRDHMGADFFLQSTKVPAAGAAAASPRCRTQPRLLVRAPPRLTEPLQLGSPQEKHKAGHEVGGDQARTEKKFICTPLSGSSVKIAFVLRASAI